MFYENELRLLCDTFNKCRVDTAILSPSDQLSNIIDTEIEAIFGNTHSKTMTFEQLFGNVDDRTVYRYTDHLSRRYEYLKLPSAKPLVLLIGPHLSEPFLNTRIFELGEKLGLSPKDVKYLEEYCISTPIIPDNDSLFVMLTSFCERIWEQPSFTVVDTNIENLPPASPITDTANAESFDDVMMNMKAMEKRYEYENQLIRTVELGQMHKDIIFTSALDVNNFERRIADPVRNLKNYSIIMNTLLRKAAERGGVHPMYIDRISSNFAIKIEQISSPAENTELMQNMFRSYCRLVRKHSMKSFSGVTQKAVLLIDSDLSANLSLSSLANAQNISPGYLSSIFKKDTGKTVSEYIRDKRIKHAAHLLSTTNLQIQTVALHCGVMDVQYFSKLFKKQMGKAPKEYRESVKQRKGISDP